jgi:hypothetical protein
LVFSLSDFEIFAVHLSLSPSVSLERERVCRLKDQSKDERRVLYNLSLSVFVSVVDENLFVSLCNVSADSISNIATPFCSKPRW